MKNTPADTKMPFPASRHSLLQGAPIPKEIADLIMRAKSEYYSVPNEVSALVYDERTLTDVYGGADAVRKDHP